MCKLGKEDKDFFLETFLRLVQIESASEQGPDRCPTTDGQLKVGDALIDIMEYVGLENVRRDEHGYVFGTLPANLPPGSKPLSIGLIAHMDTSPEGKGEDDVIKPSVIVYQGGDITLENGTVITESGHPHLRDLVGEEIIVTDGRSLLGGDDKAGIAEILTMINYLTSNPTMLHPTIEVCFVPDEEIGHQVAHLDLENWKVDHAYTVDGGELGEYSVETFSAIGAKVTIEGKFGHPGHAKKNKSVSAITVARYFLTLLDDLLPPAERSEGREPHTTVVKMEGSYEKMVLHILLRGFENDDLENQVRTITKICDTLQNDFETSSITESFKPSYSNMAEFLKARPDIEEMIIRAMNKVSVTPLKEPIRGGTDGSALSARGVPCPNLFTGTMDMHAKTEHLVLPWAHKAIEVLLALTLLWGEECLRT